MSYRDRLIAREAELGRPLRVGLVGAGQMGRGFAAQLLRMPGVTLSAVLDVQRVATGEVEPSRQLGRGRYAREIVNQSAHRRGIEWPERDLTQGSSVVQPVQ